MSEDESRLLARGIAHPIFPHCNGHGTDYGSHAPQCKALEDAIVNALSAAQAEIERLKAALAEAREVIDIKNQKIDDLIEQQNVDYSGRVSLQSENARLRKCVADERAAWRGMMKNLGPWLVQAKEDGTLDQLIEGNIWPEPARVISEADVQKSIRIAREIRPEIEMEREARSALSGQTGESA